MASNPLFIIPEFFLHFPNGTFLQQLKCGYVFPALIHVWIASAGVLELFISTSGEATSACKPF